MTNPNEKKAADDFLPMSKKAMKRRGWSQCDFVFVIGDAYVDHSSFGPAIISRHLEANGYKVGIISQPDWKDDASITKLGAPAREKPRIQLHSLAAVFISTIMINLNCY